MTGRRAMWTRFAMGAVVWSVVAAVAQCWMAQPQHHAAHHGHPLAAAVGGEFAVDSTHAHATDDAGQPCPLHLAAIALPHSDAMTFAAHIVAGAVAVASVQQQFMLPAGRGPPGVLHLPGSGRDLLTRYCLARR